MSVFEITVFLNNASRIGLSICSYMLILFHIQHLTIETLTKKPQLNDQLFTKFEPFVKYILPMYTQEVK